MSSLSKKDLQLLLSHTKHIHGVTNVSKPKRDDLLRIASGVHKAIGGNWHSALGLSSVHPKLHSVHLRERKATGGALPAIDSSSLPRLSPEELKSAMEYALSGEDLFRGTQGQAVVRLYPELNKMTNLEQVFQGKDACIILYETKWLADGDVFGHWVAI